MQPYFTIPGIDGQEEFMDTGLQIKRRQIKAERAVAASFLLVILVGSLLLSLPFSAASGEATPYPDALFTAVSAVCVTGLVTVTTALHWSLFGKLVILILIQIGGLGIMCIVTGFFLALRRRLSLGEQRILQQSYNLEQLEGVVTLVKRILAGTLVTELLGTIGYAFCLIPQFGPAEGLFLSLFNAVSCFCNAGMDIIGEGSLTAYVSDPLMNVTTMLLIVLGGLGFIVWWDVIGCLKGRWGRQRRRNRRLSLHSRLVLTVTAVLIVLGTLLILLFDWQNPQSLGPLSIPNKVMAALFQSVTTRTAGFETIPQASFSDASALTSMVLMLIGGSPLGTAGGLKTTTVALVILQVYAFLRGEDRIVLFRRRIAADNVRTAFVVVLLGLSVLLVGMLLLLTTVRGSFLDTAFETVSALGTVGLTRGLTGELNNAGKLIVSVLMYLGRIGPVTLMLALIRRKKKEFQIQYPEQKIMIG